MMAFPEHPHFLRQRLVDLPFLRREHTERATKVDRYYSYGIITSASYNDGVHFSGVSRLRAGYAAFNGWWAMFGILFVHWQ